MKSKSKIFGKRRGLNRKNPVASKLRTAEFKPRLIPNKKRQAKDVPTLEDY